MEICHILKSDNRYQHPFVLLMSAEKLENIAPDAFVAGADGVLEKPLNWDELKTAIFNLLGE